MEVKSSNSLSRVLVRALLAVTCNGLWHCGDMRGQDHMAGQGSTVGRGWSSSSVRTFSGELTRSCEKLGPSEGGDLMTSHWASLLKGPSAWVGLSFQNMNPWGMALIWMITCPLLWEFSKSLLAHIWERGYLVLPLFRCYWKWDLFQPMFSKLVLLVYMKKDALNLVNSQFAKHS